MKSTFELRSKFDCLLQELPEQTRQELSIEYGFASPLHGLIDVVIKKGGQCMALGRFHPVAAADPSGFSDRFRIAMGYPDDTWYLFDFDGENMVINDLSLNDPEDEYPESPEQGIRRLATTPEEWQAEEKKFQEMKQFLEAVRDLIDEETLNEPVNK